MRAAAFFGIRHLAGDDGFGSSRGRPRLRMRASWTSRGAETVMIVLKRFSAPVSNKSGMSSKTARRLARKAAARNFASS